MPRVKEVLFHVNKMLNYMETKEGLTEEEKRMYEYTPSRWGRREYFDCYYNQNRLGIETYKRNQLTKTMLKDMKMFLDEAVKYGFLGDVRFRNGARDGMWASSRTGSEEEKKGETVLYHTFNSDYSYWKIFNDKGKDLTNGGLNTKNDLKRFIRENYI